jgi:hypothetical protein
MAADIHEVHVADALEKAALVVDQQQRGVLGINGGINGVSNRGNFAPKIADRFTLTSRGYRRFLYMEFHQIGGCFYDWGIKGRSCINRQAWAVEPQTGDSWLV